METVAFCEIDPFCRKVLKKHWPDVPIFEDIKTLRGDEVGSVDVVCGGFPCQPFSCAGLRQGKEDDRFLWPEMFRIIRETRPTWVIGENVAGFIGMEFDNCAADLEAEGYEVQAFIIPACAVNAPHRRDRVWIVANRADTGLKILRQERENTVLQIPSDCHAPHATSREPWKQAKSEGWEDIGRGSWQEPWIEAATRLCGISYGVPRELHIIGEIENGKMEGIKTESEINSAIREILLYMWEQRESAKTSPDIYERGFCNLVPTMPPPGTHEEWNMGAWIEGDAEVRDLWGRFYAERFTSSQDLQCKLLEQVRKIERRKAVEKRDRFNRLKALGNAVVPQIVEVIGRCIIKAEYAMMPQKRET